LKGQRRQAQKSWGDGPRLENRSWSEAFEARLRLIERIYGRLEREQSVHSSCCQTDNKESDLAEQHGADFVRNEDSVYRPCRSREKKICRKKFELATTDSIASLQKALFSQTIGGGWMLVRIDGKPA
jgi:ribosomal protein L24E